ncbi:hypothetical protein BZA70DRAFT_285388 [Myxozyma melibiosi]|uniref:Replication protein A C-terminal domain-containing protein n=1 Tax=Myxozyma melibiosi TaxID=54550 RepID=A0ABR1EYA3_9ASCO
MSNYNSYGGGDSYGGYGGGGYGGGSDGGGGYMNGNSFGGGEGNGETKYSSQGGDHGLPEGKTRLRPVTMKQILEANQAHADAPYLIDGVEVVNVSAVGIVRNVTHATTNSTYRIEDSTGMVDVRKINTPDERDAERTDPFPQVGDYVRILGELNDFNDKRYVILRHIRPARGLDEITYSMLEPLYVHMQTVNPSSLGPKLENGGSGSGAAAAAAGGNSYEYENLTPIQRRVVETLKSMADQDMNEGTHVQTIASRTNMSKDAVASACEQLADLGLAYTTVDYDHVCFLVLSYSGKTLLTSL